MQLDGSEKARCRAVALLGLVAFAQMLRAQGSAAPVPLWPQDDKPPRDLQGNYVYLNQPADQIVVVIPGVLRGEPDGSLEIVRVTFRNRFDPQVRVSIDQTESGRYRYLYAFSNGAAAKDAIKSWTIVTPCQDQPFGFEAFPNGWTCGRTNSGLARQYALPRISGLACYADCFLKVPQPPRSSTTQIAFVSGEKPGLTTASAGGSYPPFEVQFDWPDVILSQLSRLGDYAWSQKHVVTLGPRFSRETPIPVIASDFLQGLNDLIRAGRLAADARLVRDLKTILAQISAGNTSQISIDASPFTELEGEILNAMRLSLRLGPSKQ